MHVPDQRARGIVRPCGDDVRLEAIGMDDIRRDHIERVTHVSFVRRESEGGAESVDTSGESELSAP
jgi:hypothetical protein